MTRASTSMGRGRLLPLAGGLVATALALTACSGTGSSTDPQSGAASDDHLTLYYPYAWTNFDVQALALLGVNQLSMLAYDTPFMYIDGELVPYLGEMVEESTSSVTFSVRGGVLCADGHELTASDVARSLNRTFTGASANAYFGAGPLEATADDAEGAVTVTTQTPFVGLSMGLAGPAASIVCPSGLDQLETDPTWLETNFDGTGPYTMTSSVAGASVEFELREDWTWGPEGSDVAKMPGTLTFQVSANPTTTANSLLTDSIAIGSLAGPDAERLNAAGGFDHQASPTSFQMLVFNMRDGRPTTDEALRQALAASVNRQDFLLAMTNGVGTTVPGAFPEGDLSCFDPAIVFPYDGDIDAAREILTAGGYTYSGDTLLKDGAPVSLSINSSTNFNASGEYLLSQFSALGIDVKLNDLEFTAYNQDQVEGNFDVANVQNVYRYPSAADYAGYVYGPAAPAGLNRTGYEDPEWTRLWTEALQRPANEACDLWVQIQEHIVDGAVPFVGMAVTDTLFYGKGEYDYKVHAYYVKPQYLVKR